MPGAGGVLSSSWPPGSNVTARSEEHTSELQSPCNLVCRLLLEKKKSNAIKHSNRSDTRVRVAVREHDDFYEFIVEDNGPGIARQFHGKIWDIFQTLQPRDNVEGAGIGLALVRKNVESRAGRAWLDSDEGRGAKFFFLWPKHVQEEG